MSPLMTMKTSVRPSVDIILSAYNQPEYLDLVLEGYCRQTDPDFGLIVADDGSTDEVRQVVLRHMESLKLSHVWHEDSGFRRTVIMNKALKQTTADYVILSDGDCIPTRYFVEDHKKAADKGFYATGRRADLMAKPTEQLLRRSIKRFDNITWLLPYLVERQVRHLEALFRPPAFIHRIWSMKKRGAIGANMAAWRQDLLSIGGFDESFLEYGMEETDLELRLQHHGVQCKSLMGRAALLHLYHAPRAMGQTSVETFQKKHAPSINF
jgi:glycosyltransferase involved in cell wall biosynthesis